MILGKAQSVNAIVAIRCRILRWGIAPVTVAIVAILPIQAQPPSRTVRYDLKMEEPKYVYGVFPPVARLRAGDILETNTVDGEGKALEAAGRKPMGPNALTGPFYIEGAEPDDTLVIKFQMVDVDGNLGYGSAGPGFGALNSTHYTPMLGPGIPTKTWTYQIDKAA